MYHTLKLSTDPTPLLEANNNEFKILLSKKPSKNRWLTTGDHPIFLDNRNAINYKPYNEIGSEILNERKKIIYKNKSLADKFKIYEIDRKIEKEENISQDNIFPESKIVSPLFHSLISALDKSFTLTRLTFSPTSRVISGHWSSDGGVKTASPEPSKVKCAWRVAAQLGIITTGFDAA